MRLARALIALSMASVAFAVVPTPAAFAADRNFAPRFTANDTGDIDIVGNTVMTCQTTASGCVAARAAGPSTSASSANNNNNYNMVYVDTDADTSTFNSSQATVSVPAGATVLFAGLYWGGEVTAGASGTAAPGTVARNTVKLKEPGATDYSTVTASTVDDGSVIYQGFADVTSRVSAAGSGVYTVGNIQTGTGADRLGGWSLVMAYRDPTMPVRNLTIFDGLKSINGSGAGTINVSGFTTPKTGPVNTTLGFVTYEGDLGLVGDGASFNGVALSDGQHPATNFFDSISSRGATLRTGTNPAYPNNLGYENSMLSVGSSYLANGATSATIGLTTAGDVYAPGVVTFATDLYAPDIDQTTTVTDLNGGLAEQGDTLRYTVAGSNKGQNGAADFVLRNPIPDDTTYVPGSLKVTPVAGTTAAATDAAGDDLAEFDTAGNRVVARLGTGATRTAGGLVEASGSYAVVFDVVVDGPEPAVADGTTIAGTATASFTSASLGTALTATSGATTTVAGPDLKVAVSHTGTLARGDDAAYSLDVSNVGSAASQGTVTVSDDLPAGLSYVSASGTGWTCGEASGTVTCTRTSAVAAGASYPSITLDAGVATAAPDSVTNTASVTGGGDGLVANNTGSATNAVKDGTFVTGPTASISGDPVSGGTLTAVPGPTQTGTTTPVADSFSYEWAADGDPIADETGPTLVLTPATIGKTITVTVTATRSGYTDVSDESDPTAAVAKAPQLITFTAPTGVSFGSGDVDLGATSSSDLPVTYASTSTAVCTIVDGKLHVVAAGDCTVQADQAGSNVFAPAPQVERTFFIGKAAQTITFTAPSGTTFGDADSALGATSSSDLPVTYTSTTTAVCTIADGKLHVVSAGDCTVQADQDGDSNHGSAPQVERTFSIGKAAQTITFTAPVGVRVGDTDAELGATSSSDLPVTYTSTTTAVCTIVDGKVHAVSAGDCAIQAEQEGNGNYFAAPQVERTFSVAEAPGTAPGISGEATASGVKNSPFVYAPTVTGDPAPSVTLQGAPLPAGLTLDSTSGRITGTPTVVGTFPVTLRAANRNGADTTAVTITIADDHVLGLAPMITGTPREGRTLTAHAGPVVPSGATLTYRWRVNGDYVRGATRSTLKLGKAEAGRRVSVTVTARAAGRIKQTATSSRTAIVSSSRSRLVLSTYSVRSTSRFEVVATGLRPHQRYVVWLGGVDSYRGRADQHGTVRRTVKFSSRIASGNRRVRVSGYTGAKRTSTTYTTVRLTRR